MKIDLVDISPVKKSMSVELASEEFERESEDVLRRWRGRARIPGFRPGKAPTSLIRTRFAKEVEEDLRERIVSKYFAAGARERGLRPLGNPSLEELEHEAGQPFRFKATFEVLPQIELRGYKDVQVRRKAARVDEDEVDRALEDLRQAHARLVPDEGREAALGDVIVADVQGTPEEGEPFHRERVQMQVGEPTNLPAFNEALVGLRNGARPEFSVTYPPDPPGGNLAGKTVRFSLTVHEVKRRDVPALDDEFARAFGEFEDLAALRVRVRRDLEARKARLAEQAMRQAVLDKVLLENPIVLPQVLVDEEIHHRLEDVVRGMILQGMDPEKAEIDWAGLRQRQEEAARKSVHARLILDAVAAVESITVDDHEIDERIRLEARRIGEEFGKLRGRLKKQHGLEPVRNQMVREKSLDYLSRVANIQNEE